MIAWDTTVVMNYQWRMQVWDNRVTIPFYPTRYTYSLLSCFFWSQQSYKLHYILHYMHVRAYVSISMRMNLDSLSILRENAIAPQSCHTRESSTGTDQINGMNPHSYSWLWFFLELKIAIVVPWTYSMHYCENTSLIFWTALTGTSTPLKKELIDASHHK